MCPFALSALLGLAPACPPPSRARLLAPADPAIHGRWTPPPSPVAGLKRYAPVDATARGWLGGDGVPGRGTAMPPTPGISGHGP